MQITDTIIMVRPASFSYNRETAVNNYFQNPASLPNEELQLAALTQFDAMVDTLAKNGIEVIVINDTKEPVKPDAIFPNNWFTATNAGNFYIFPLHAQSRRLEKRADIVQLIERKFDVKNIIDWSEMEDQGMFLEGTGSMVMDHDNRIIYACLSPRTHMKLVERYATEMNYRAMVFTANDEEGRLIYHTNVMMCIGDEFAVLCPKAISDHTERIAVAQLLETTSHENIYITHQQMNEFAGNMLQLKNKAGDKLIVMSKRGFASLEAGQVKRLERYGTLLPIDVSIIEKVEGGSVRCMIAEVFLRKMSDE